MSNNYAFKNFTENMAKAIGKDLPVSTKQAVEICNFIRGKKLIEAKRLLAKVIEKKIAVPFKRYNKDMPHRTGRIASGRYPFNTTEHILKLLGGVESNAEDKGLNIDSLAIKHACAHKAARPWRFGRQRRRKARRTHIEIVVEECNNEKVGPELKSKK